MCIQNNSKLTISSFDFLILAINPVFSRLTGIFDPACWNFFSIRPFANLCSLVHPGFWHYSHFLLLTVFHHKLHNKKASHSTKIRKGILTISFEFRKLFIDKFKLTLISKTTQRRADLAERRGAKMVRE